MFRRKVKPLSEILGKLLREEGLEAPLLQKRIVSVWDIVGGQKVEIYTQEMSFRNQAFVVHITIPAVGLELAKLGAQLVKRLNDHVGSFVISDIRIY